MENIIKENKYLNGELIGYELRPKEGYVIRNLQDVTEDEEGNPIKPTYFKVIGIPTSFSLENYVAVPIEEDMEIV